MAARRVALALACLLGLTACSSADSEPEGTRNPTESLSGDDLCRMLPLDRVERQFDDVEFFRAEGQESGRGLDTGISCNYGGGGLSLRTTVRKLLARQTVEAHLDLEFTEVDVDLNEEVIEYERLDGLGAAAGYGQTVPLGLAGNTLAVILIVGRNQYKVGLSTRPDATLEELKPLAEVLVPHVQSALR